MKSKISLWFLIAITVLLFYQPVVSQTIEKQYNLNELVNIAFQNNPQIKANEKTIQAGLKQIDFLDKDYLPQIFFDLNISRWDWVMPNKQKNILAIH
ncbi:MAG: TolC family protein [Candidatus Kapaibacteriota bacterium]